MNTSWNRNAIGAGALIVAMLTGGVTNVARAAVEDYQPVPLAQFNFDNNPCVKAASHDEKVKRNIAIAELYFQAYLEGRERGIKKRGWGEHGCMAKDMTFAFGVYMPPPAKPVVRPDWNQGEDVEFTRWRKTFPNFGVVPGTFRIMAVDEGTITWVNSFGGPQGDLIATDGEHSPAIWEVEVIRVNGDGKITHWDSWTDPLSTDRAMRKIFGKSYLNDFQNYKKDLEKGHTEGKPK